MAFVAAAAWDSDAAGARIGSDEYGSVSEALEASVPGDVVFAVPGADGSCDLSGNSSVPEHVTLVLPYSSGCGPSGTAYGDDGGSDKTSSDRRLNASVPKGSVLDVRGTLIVGGVLSKPFAFGYQGHTSGPYAQLTLNGTLRLHEGSSLLCYGFIKGSGTVEALSGSEIREPFVITDYVGGDNVYCSYSAGQSPFNRYAMYNIQSKFSMEYGAVLYGMVNLYANGTANKGEAAVVGPDAGLIVMAEGSRLSSTYRASEYVEDDWESNIYRDIGKKRVRIEGGASTGAVVIDVQDNRADTSRVVFSVPYNYDFALASGEYSIESGFRFLPGSGLTVEKDAVLTVKGALLMYDGLIDHEFRDKHYPSPDLLAEYGFDKIARLTVDGTLDVKGTLAGAVQCSGSGAVLRTEPGSVLSLRAQYGAKGSLGTSAVDTVTVRTLGAYVYRPSGEVLHLASARTYSSVDDVEHTIASFRYTDVAAGQSEKAVAINQTIKGSWLSEPMRIVYDANRGSGDPPADDGTYTDGDRAVALSPGNLSKSGAEFLGWSYRSDSRSGLVQPGDEFVVRGDVVLYAAWSVGHFYITTTAPESLGKVIQGSSLDVEEHEDVVVSFLPKDGYRVEETFVDGSSVGDRDVVRFDDVSSSHTVRFVVGASEGTVSKALDDGTVIERTRTVSDGMEKSFEKRSSASGHVERRAALVQGSVSGEAVSSPDGTSALAVCSFDGASDIVVAAESVGIASRLAGMAAESVGAPAAPVGFAVRAEGAKEPCTVRVGGEAFLAAASLNSLQISVAGWDATVPISLLRTVRNAVDAPDAVFSFGEGGARRMSMSVAGELDASAGPDYSSPGYLTAKKDGWTASIHASLLVRTVRTSMSLEMGEDGAGMRSMSFSGTAPGRVPAAEGSASFSSPEGWGLSLPASSIMDRMGEGASFRLSIGPSATEGEDVSVATEVSSVQHQKMGSRILASMPYVPAQGATVRVMQAEADGSLVERPSSMEGGVLTFDAYGTSGFSVVEEIPEKAVPKAVMDMILYAVAAIAVVAVLVAAFWIIRRRR